MLTPKHRPVSHPRSSNRTCPFRASGFPMDFTAGSRNSRRRAKPKDLEFAKDPLIAIVLGAAQLHLMAPFQEMPYAIGDVIVDFSIRRGAGTVGKVGRPASENLIEAGAHFFPCSNVFRASRDLPLSA